MVKWPNGGADLMQRQRWLLMTVAVLAVSCGKKAPAGKNYNFYWISKQTDNPTFVPGWQGARDKAAELSQGGPDTVSVTLGGPTGNTVASVQIDNINTAIAKNFDGIIIGADDASVNPAINQAVAAGIPVMTFDSDAPGTQRFAFYAFPDAAAGTDLANRALALPAVVTATHHEYAIVSGSYNANNLQNRAQGVLTAMQAANWTLDTPADGTMLPTTTDSTGKPVTGVAAGITPPSLGIYDGAGQAPGDSVARVEAAITQHPNLTILFLTATAAFRCAGAGTSLSGSDSICTASDVDAMPNWKAAAQNGLVTVALNALPQEVTAMTSTPPLTQILLLPPVRDYGTATVQMLYDYVKGRYTPPSGGIVAAPYDLVCPNNAHQVLADWSSGIFPDTPLPPCTTPSR